MVAAAVTGAASPPASAWALAPGVAEHTQGLVATGFAWLPGGRALLLQASRPGGAWLRALRTVAPVTDAVPRPRAERPGRAAALAFTSSGLAALGLPGAALASFAAPFRGGMFQPDRARRLGDRRFGAWLPTVVEAGPEWSGNPKPPPPPEVMLPYGVALPPENIMETVPRDTPATVHAILLLYTGSDAEAAAWCADVEAALAPHGVAVLRRLELEMDVLQRDAASGISREHFGFADGLSQPLPYDPGGAVLLGGEAVRVADPVHGVPLGEFLLGFPDAYGEIPPGPVISAEAPGAAALPPRCRRLPRRRASPTRAGTAATSSCASCTRMCRRSGPPWEPPRRRCVRWRRRRRRCGPSASGHGSSSRCATTTCARCWPRTTPSPRPTSRGCPLSPAASRSFSACATARSAARR